jgi:hypothetical protein
MKSDFQERIIAVLQGGLRTGLRRTKLLLGDTAGNISSRLSKLAAYGIIGKAYDRRGPRGNVYRALTDKQATV